jgi:hypothetical protein
MDSSLSVVAANKNDRLFITSVLLSDACSLVSDLIMVDRKICRFTRQISIGITVKELITYRSQIVVCSKKVMIRLY